jgi:membrane protein
MANPAASIESAEARVADARAGIETQLRRLRSSSKRVATSPYLIGGLVSVAAAAGFLAVRRKRATPPPQAMPLTTRQSTAINVLRAAQAALPLLGAAFAAFQRVRKARAAPVAMPIAISMPRNPVEPAAEADEPAAEPLPAGWAGRHWHMAKAAVNAWADDYAPSMGAALSYYTLFSIAPLLIIVIAVAGMVFGQEAAQGAIVAQLNGIMGEEGAIAVEGMLKAAREPAKSVFATIAGVAALLLGATAIFGELQSALDRIWRVPAAKKQSGIFRMLRTRLLSFGLVLGLGFLLTVSLVVSAGLAAFGKWWGGWLEGWDVILEVVNFVASLGIFTVLFAMIYKLMPRARISWRDVWTGAAVTAVLFAVGKLLIGLYLGKIGLASGFGAAGALVVMLVWVYYSAQIFLLGAEYTWVYASRVGSRSRRPQVGAATEVPRRSVS